MYMDYYGGMWMFLFFGIIVFVIIIALIFRGNEKNYFKIVFFKFLFPSYNNQNIHC